MDYGIDGNMRVNIADEQLYIDSAMENSRRTDMDDSQINSLLELEIQAVTLELEEEKKRSSAERVECTKHLADLEDAERELFRCQTDLQRSEQNLAKAQAQIEASDKNEELSDAEKNLMRCRQRIEELEQQIEQMGEQSRQEGILDTSQASLTDLHQCIAQSHRVRRNGSTNELVKPLQSQIPRDSVGQEVTLSLSQMNELLQETLEEQTKLTLQIKALEDEVQIWKENSKTAKSRRTKSGERWMTYAITFEDPNKKS